LCIVLLHLLSAYPPPPPKKKTEENHFCYLCTVIEQSMFLAFSMDLAIRAFAPSHHVHSLFCKLTLN
jgi:hypothetical protein